MIKHYLHKVIQLCTLNRSISWLTCFKESKVKGYMYKYNANYINHISILELYIWSKENTRVFRLSAWWCFNQIIDKCSMGSLKKDVETGKTKSILVNEEGKSIVYRKGMGFFSNRLCHCTELDRCVFCLFVYSYSHSYITNL